MTIVVTGPESTGKTTLAEALADALSGLFIPEFARFYLAHFDRPYTRADMRSIGRGQRSWEDWGRAHASRPLICDTDWTVLHIWETYRFVKQPVDWSFTAPTDLIWSQGYGNCLRPDRYLLCAPDFPWHPDPLREHPNEQWELYRWYEQLLQQTGVPYLPLEGPPEVRLRAALNWL
jgi:nicotinamide riboside kinase